MNIKKYTNWWHKEIGGKLLLPVIMIILGNLFTLDSLPPKNEAKWILLVTIALFCFGWVVDDFIRWNLREKQTNKNIDWMRDHLENLSVYHTLCTDNNYLEELISSSNQIASKARWLIPIFISKKISAEFRERDRAEITADFNRYSDLLSQLIPFCSYSIYMTCPYSPNRWFQKLLPNEEYQRAVDGKLKEEEFPIHIRELLLLKDVNKRRFVILRDINEAKSFAEDRPARECFLKFSNSKYQIDTKFAYKPVLCKDCERLKNKCDLWKRDFQIWDGMVAVEHLNNNRCMIWIKPNDPLKLLFDECWTRRGSYSLEQINKLSKNAKRKDIYLDNWDTTIRLL